MPQRSAHAALCLILGGVLERFPGLRCCLAHGGGAFPFTIGRFWSNQCNKVSIRIDRILMPF